MDTGFLVVIAVVACIAFAALVDTLLKQWRKSRKKEKEENISPEIEILAGAHPDSDASRKDEHEDPVQSEADCLEAERKSKVQSRLRELDRARSAAYRGHVAIAVDLLGVEEGEEEGPETESIALEVRRHTALAFWSMNSSWRAQRYSSDLEFLESELPFRLVDNTRDLGAMMEFLFLNDHLVETVSTFVKEHRVNQHVIDAWAKKTFEALPQNIGEQMTFVSECRRCFVPGMLTGEVQSVIVALSVDRQFLDAIVFARRFGEESSAEIAEMACFTHALTVGEYSFSVIHENKVTNRRVTPKNYPR